MTIYTDPSGIHLVMPAELAALFQQLDPCYERPLIHWAGEACLKPDKTFLDIGAHVGSWALTYAKRVPRVVAVEANYRNYAYLMAGIALNEAWNVEAHHAAAGTQHGGKATINVGVHDWSGFGGSLESFPINGVTREEKVPAITIDSLGLTGVGFVKIDVEGYELEVLSGMAMTLSQNRYPPLMVEVWDTSNPDFRWYQEKRAKTLALLREYGYRAVDVSGSPHMQLCVHD